MTNEELCHTDLRASPGKQCSTCRELLPISAFSRNRKKLRSNCKQCARKSKADWYLQNKSITAERTAERRKRKIDRIQQLKSEQPCSDCGKFFHFSLMDFDHRDGETKAESVSFLAGSLASEEAISAEIAKCDLVCCMCHRVRTWNRSHPEEQIMPS